VAKHRRQAEVFDAAHGLFAVCEQRILARGVDDVARTLAAAIGVHRDALGVWLDVAHAHASLERGARLFGLLEHQGIEFGALYLIGVRGRALEPLTEEKARVIAGALVVEVGAALVQKACRAKVEAKPLEQREVARKQRLADVKARKIVFVHQQDAGTASGE
jgi:hypothetical protein